MLNTTIFIVTNPLGIVSCAFTTEEAAKKEAVQRMVDFGETYPIEQCSLEIDPLFLKRVEQMFINYKKKEGSK